MNADAARRQLDDSGYTLLHGYMQPELLAALRQAVDNLYAEEGARAGGEFLQEPNARRLANLVDKGEVFREIIQRAEILELVGHVLGPRFKLSSLNARSANPHSDSSQPLHCDMRALPDERGYWVCNTVWMLDDFTAANGALRLVPGSHRWGRLPQEAVSDPSASHPGEILITGPAGSVVVMNAHVWHGGTANRTAAARGAVHGFYCRWDKPQQQYQKKLLRAEVQAQLSPWLRQILALDDPQNDELSAAVAVRSGFMK